MKAASVDPDKDYTLDKLRYPVIASPKLDGIRAVVRDGSVLSNALKSIPNLYIRDCVGRAEMNGFDGELMTGGFGEPFDTSGVMTKLGKPDFKFHVFDDFTNPSHGYVRRIGSYTVRVAALAKRYPFLLAVPTILIRDFESLMAYTEKCLGEGYEGAMVRAPEGVYKFGRATFNEGLLIKIKPFEDAEAVVIGFEEQMENTNEKTTNELGRSKRSSHKSGKIGKNTLGALVLLSEEFGEFNCGTGMNEAMRALVWANRGKYLGKKVTFKFQRIGMKDKPRIPVFKCFRHKNDL